MISDPNTESPQLEAALSLFYGATVGLAFALVVVWLLGRRNLRPSFALAALVVPGYLCVSVLDEPFLGGLLGSAGVWGALVRRLRIGMAMKAGGELAHQARRARSIRQVARDWRDRQRVRRYGPLDFPGAYAVGEDENRAVVRLRWAGARDATLS